MKTCLPGALMFVVACATAAQAAGPEGWMLAGSAPSSYVMERDTKVLYEGKPSARLASKSKSAGFGTMMQCIDAVDYRGKRMRFTGYVKAQEVGSWAGLWMRVDGAGSPPVCLAFDNMGTRTIKGTADFKRYDVVLDVAPTATNFCFGILLDGEGTVWLSGVKLEPVPTTVPVTDLMKQQSRAPKNLDFER